MRKEDAKSDSLYFAGRTWGKNFITFGSHNPPHALFSSEYPIALWRPIDAMTQQCANKFTELEKVFRNKLLLNSIKHIYVKMCHRRFNNTPASSELNIPHNVGLYSITPDGKLISAIVPTKIFIYSGPISSIDVRLNIIFEAIVDHPNIITIQIPSIGKIEYNISTKKTDSFIYLDKQRLSGPEIGVIPTRKIELIMADIEKIIELLPIG